MKWVAGAAVAAGAVVAIVLTLVIGRSPGPGPFAWPAEAGTTTLGWPRDPGQTVAGSIVMPRTLGTDAVLLDVRPIHPEDARDGVALQYGAMLDRGATRSPRGMFGGDADGWHPRKWGLRPVSGFVIPAHVRGSVMVGVTLGKQWGVHLIRGFVIDYRVGGTPYSAPMQIQFELCDGMRRCP